MTKITPEIAEIAGAFAADGSMQKGHICLWGNINEDREYHDVVLKRLFREAFNCNINPHEKKSNFVYGFYVCDKNIINFFNTVLGFNFGNKTYTVGVPKCILEANDPIIWASFIRGFSDGDGSLNFCKRYGTCQEILKIIHTYPQIQLKTVSKRLALDLLILISKLGFKPHLYPLKNNKFGKHIAYLVELKGKKNLENWMQIISFNNPVQQTRYAIFKKYGFVPVNTTLLQRKGVLEEKIDIWSFYPKWTRGLAWIRRQDKVVPLEPSKLR